MCEGAIHFLLIVLVVRHLTCHTLFQMERRQLSPKYLPAASAKTARCCLPRREVISLEEFRLLCAIKPSSAHAPPNLLPQLPKTTIKKVQAVLGGITLKEWVWQLQNPFLSLLGSHSTLLPAGYCTDWKDKKGLSTFHC